MAKAAISQEEIQLRKRARRRLAGASFLVLVMIIVLPVILDSEPRPQAESVRVQMPASVRESQQENLAPAPPSPASGEAASAALLAENSQDVTLAEGQNDVAAVDRTASAPAEELTPPVVIQLGAFAEPANAKQLQDALASEGIKAFAEVVTSGQASTTRVRAGPFDSIAEAERTRDRIAKMKLKLGIEPKIVARGQ